MAGWGNFFGKIAEQFQGRTERLKNERAKLVKERDELERINMDITKKEDREKSFRLGSVINRIDTIDELLRNKAGS